MQHELPILLNITVALLAAFIGGVLARLLKLPSMVGYMLAVVAIGPFTPGFIGDLFTIQQLAEHGDAANSDILSQVHLRQARAVVVTLPGEARQKNGVGQNTFKQGEARH